jgi:hypothetical protein
LPKGIIGKIGVAVSADSNRVYAMVEAEDGGCSAPRTRARNWARVSADRRIRQRAFLLFAHHRRSQRQRHHLHALNTGLYRSTDGGKTVKQLRPPHGDHHDLWIAPNDPTA